MLLCMLRDEHAVRLGRVKCRYTVEGSPHAGTCPERRQTVSRHDMHVVLWRNIEGSGTWLRAHHLQAEILKSINQMIAMTSMLCAQHVVH